MSIWLNLDSGSCPPAFNMAMDEALMELSPTLAAPVLRFYGWTEPAATFGYFQRFAEIERLTMLRPLLRRPTAGGLVPHDADWTYSLAFPASHEWHGVSARESYRRVHDWLRLAFGRLGVATELAPCAKPGAGQCFIGYEESDLLWHGRKIAGAAQRRTNTALLIQGSVQPPLPHLRRADWQAAMRAVAAELWAVEWQEMVLPEAHGSQSKSVPGGEGVSLARLRVTEPAKGNESTERPSPALVGTLSPSDGERDGVRGSTTIPQTPANQSHRSGCLRLLRELANSLVVGKYSQDDYHRKR